MQHEHNWYSRFIIIDGVDVLSGMRCDCGQVIRQDVVEDAVNALQKLATNPSYSTYALKSLGQE